MPNNHHRNSICNEKNIVLHIHKFRIIILPGLLNGLVLITSGTNWSTSFTNHFLSLNIKPHTNTLLAIVQYTVLLYQHTVSCWSRNTPVPCVSWGGHGALISGWYSKSHMVRDVCQSPSRFQIPYQCHPITMLVHSTVV